jgi:hypothetical protein
MVDDGYCEPILNSVHAFHFIACRLIRSSGKIHSAILGEEDTPDADSPYSKLDTVLLDLGYTSCPEFIRIVDYGGNEIRALQGAASTLKCTKLVCVTGLLMRHNVTLPFAGDVISYMNDNGFAIYNTYENHRVRFFNTVIDILFVKKELMDEMYEVGFKSHYNKPAKPVSANAMIEGEG